MALRINRIAAAAMAIILIGAALRGFAGFSQSTAYDVFHLIFGLIGLAAAFARGGRYAPLFNIGFGAIDAYQAIAFFAGIFPTQLFNLTWFDTVSHIVIAAVLITIGVAGLIASRRAGGSG
jgi:hypothetical protein